LQHFFQKILKKREELTLIKKISALFIALALAMVSLNFTFVYAKANGAEEVFEELSRSNFKVVIVGEENKFDGKTNIKRIDSFNQLNSTEYDTVWISKEESKNVLDQKNLGKIQNILKSGKTLFFLGEHNSQVLADYLNYDINLTEELLNKNEISEVATYIMAETNGTLVFGKVLKSHDVTIDREFETMITEAWLKRDNVNRRGDINTPGELSKNQKGSYSLFSNQLMLL
jgi:hypothetical protein